MSPDINPIEHLWDYLERAIRIHTISSKTDLKNVLINEWNNITNKITSNLVNSIPRRLAVIIKSKGSPIKY